MGVGSALAIGCNVGAFYTPLINLSASGFPMLVGLMVGGLSGLTLPSLGTGEVPFQSRLCPDSQTSGKNSFDWKSVQPYLGAAGTPGVDPLGLWVCRSGLHRNRRPAPLRGGLRHHPPTVPFLLCPGLSGSLHDRGSRDRQGHRLEHHHRVRLGVAVLKWTAAYGEGTYVIPAFWGGPCSEG